MLSQIFWKNAAWLCQLKGRSTFRVGVYNIKQFCAVENNDTSYDDFESLAVSADKDENLGEFSESELTYFTNVQLNTSQENSQLVSIKQPLKKSLAYTNKVLYGPLLKTSNERKKKSKKAEDETEVKQKTKKAKKPKKNETALSMDPLISKPANAHFLGVLPGDELKVKRVKSRNRKVIEHQQENDSRDGRPRNIKLLSKKLVNSVKFENSVLSDPSKIKKVCVSSWNQEKKLGIPSTSGDSTADVFKEFNEDDSLSEGNVTKNECTGNTDLPCSSSNVKTGNDQEIENLESFKGNFSLLSIDNGKFTSVPNTIDTETIVSFPLEKTESPNVLSKIAMNTDENILTIGMFDGGYQKLPSVSKILEATMPMKQRTILDRWKAKMIKELGEEGFEVYRKGLFEKGKLLHGCIHSELTGISPSVEHMPTVQGAWISLSHVLPKISSVSVLESRLIHPYLYYQGAVDCIATYKEMPVLIDWKTSSKPKLTLTSMFDNPLQVVAYLGALNYDHNYQLPHQVQSAMLVVAYDNGLPAHVHMIDREKCQAYWKVWCARLVQFWRQLEAKESA